MWDDHQIVHEGGVRGDPILTLTDRAGALVRVVDPGMGLDEWRDKTHDHMAGTHNDLKFRFWI